MWAIWLGPFPHADFLSITKRRFAEFNGVKVDFRLHLKNREWRDNKSASFLTEIRFDLIKRPAKFLI